MQNLYGCICSALNAYALFSVYFPRIGQFVQVHDPVIRVFRHEQAYYVRADKARAAALNAEAAALLADFVPKADRVYEQLTQQEG